MEYNCEFNHIKWSKIGILYYDAQWTFMRKFRMLNSGILKYDTEIITKNFFRKICI